MSAAYPSWRTATDSGSWPAARSWWLWRSSCSSAGSGGGGRRSAASARPQIRGPGAELFRFRLVAGLAPGFGETRLVPVPHRLVLEQALHIGIAGGTEAQPVTLRPERHG